MDDQKPATAAQPQVLVVDDDPILLSATAQVLRRAGFATLEAPTGADCLRVAVRERPALVLLDVVLSDTDGLEVCRRLKSNPDLASTLVAFISGRRIQSEEQAAGLNTGADGYIARPLGNQELVARVRGLLRQWSAQSEMHQKKTQAETLSAVLRMQAEATEEKLRQSEELFSLFARHMPVYMFVKDHESRTLYVNELMKQTFGAGAWLGKTAVELFPPDIASAMIADDRIALQQGVHVVEEGVPTLLGEVRQFQTIKFRIDRGDQPPLIGGVGLDITERKQVEAEKATALAELTVNRAYLQSVVDTMPVLLMAFDGKGHLVFWNQECERVTGYTRAEIANDRRLLHALFPNENERQEMLQLFASAEGVENFERALTRKDGSQRLVSWSSFSQSPSLPGWQAWIVGTDISHRRQTAELQQKSAALQEANAALEKSKRAALSLLQDANIQRQRAALALAELAASQEALVKAKEQAEAATRAKSQFLANMSHEIRTPMNAIIGMAYLARQRETDARQREYLDKIGLSAHKLLEIINDILDFSKVEAGKLALESAPFDLNQVMESLAGLLSVRARNKNIALLFALAPDVPSALIGDALRLEQVLINLGNNAVKFTEQGEIVFSVQCLRREAEQVTLQFSVRDSGIGMTAEQLQYIFQPFAQADASTTRQYGGTGLGLTISKQFVGMMGGDIWAESQPGGGSTFTFTANFGLATTPSTEPFPLEMVADRKVLVVDDLPAAQEIIMGYVQTFTSRVVVVGSGQEALQALRQATHATAFDLLIVDRQLPDGSGSEIVRAVKDAPGLYGNPATLLITGFSDADAKAEAQMAGADGVLCRPFGFSSFLKGILRVFGINIGDRPPIQPHGLPITHAAQRLHGVRILVAEDNISNQEVVREMLEMAGALVGMADNGQEAIELLQTSPFDALLMDIQMPVMDGYTAARAIRAAPADYHSIPIIAMTAHAILGDQQKSLDAGMDDHITKPINPDQLHAVLSRWIPRGEQNVSLSSAPAEAAADKIAWAAVTPQIQELIHLLQAYDIRAIELARDLLTQTGVGALADAFGQIEEHISGYHFEKALDRLQGLAQQYTLTVQD